MTDNKAKFRQRMRRNFRTTGGHIPKSKTVIRGAVNIGAVLGITDRRVRQLTNRSRADFDPRLAAAIWEESADQPGRPVLCARLSALAAIRGERDRAPKGAKSKPKVGALALHVLRLQARDSQRRK